MAWTQPNTWAPQQLVTASLMNTYVRDNLNLLATPIDTPTGKLAAISATYIKSLVGLVMTQNFQNSIAGVGSSGAAETDLITYSLPGNSLAVNGAALRITSWGTTVNNANTKIVKQYFGVAICGFSGMLNTSVAHRWIMHSMVVRTGATTQTTWSNFTSGPANATRTNATQKTTSPGQTLSGAITVKITGQGTTTGDVVCNGQAIEILQQ